MGRHQPDCFPIDLLLIRHRLGKIDALNAQQIRGGIQLLLYAGFA
jgi:hypothetical protein